MKRTVAVFFGGVSAEHDVSIITAHSPIINSLVALGEYDIYPVYISKTGSWYSHTDFLDITYFQQPDYEQHLKQLKPLQLSVNGELALIFPGLRPKSVKIDLAIPAMHGTYGEDGSLMGLLRMANVPFVGCDLFASATAMDKVLTKQVVAAMGLPVCRYFWKTKAEWAQNPSAFINEIDQLSRPLFVKPVHLGSSIGIAKVTTDAQLQQALEVAFHYDTKVLVEEGVENLIEVTLPIMGNTDLTPAMLERPLNQTEFFDFSEKYLSSGKKASGAGPNNAYSEIPAKIPEKLYKQAVQLGLDTYRALGCEGIARVDMLINSLTERLYINEVNTLPGGLYNHNWRVAGLSSVELVRKLIELADERFAQHQSLTHTFSSSILTHVSSAKLARVD